MLLQKEILMQKVIEIETNIKKLQTFDSSYFRGKHYFEEDGTQNYLVLQPVIRYFRIIANTKYISSWKPKSYLTNLLHLMLLLIIVLPHSLIIMVAK